MSNLRNRFLALAIVVMMLVAALSSTASAATTKFVDVDDPDDAKMISLLSAIGIVKGAYADEDGSMVFDSETPVSRQQMALFLARINSANPGAFEPDDSIKLTFTDVKDSTYFLAIKHCYEQGIIEGRDAETFDPLNTVKLDEALAMIVRALGFKDLSYPIETTKKAKELGFALKYADTAGKNELTRIEVMRLLYTYFYSDEQSLEIVKNEITGVQHTVRVPHPVMEKFGINVQEAYIVRSNDYTAAIGATLKTPNDEEITLPDMQIQSLTAKDVADGKDIILAYNNYKVVATNQNNDGVRYVGGYTYSGKWSYMTVSRAELGIDKDTSDREIVGLKAIYYQDTLSGTRPVALDVISYVKGTKTTVDLADKDNVTSAKMNGDYNDFTSYADGLTILGKTYNLSQYSAQASELTNADIYHFTSGTTTLSQTGNNKSIDYVKTLGGYIARGGNFGLEYVDNGDDETYFIFTPYTVGYYFGEYKTNDDTVTWYNLANRPYANDPEKGTLVKSAPDSSRNVKIKDAKGADKSLTVGEAYLYTIEGRYLNIFATLTKVVDSKYPEYIINDKIGLGSKDIELKSKNAYFAIGATTSVAIANDKKSADKQDDKKAVQTDIRVGGKYSAFALNATSDIFYIVQVDGAPTVGDGMKYGVLTAEPTPVANYLGTARYMYMYSVFTYNENNTVSMTSEILVTPYDYYSGVKLQAGQLVSWQKIGDYYRIGAFDQTNYLFNSGSSIIGDYARRTGSGVSGVPAGSGYNYTPYTDSLLRLTSVYGDSLTGVINSSTEILVAEYRSIPTPNAIAATYANNINNSTSGLVTSNFMNARRLTLNDFNTLMNTESRRGMIFNIEMITDSGNFSAAKVILISIEYEAYLDYNTDDYLVITSLKGTTSSTSGNSTFYLADAYSYKTGRKTVAVPVGSNYKVGNLVRITGERFTSFDNTQYWIAREIATPANKNAVKGNYVGSTGWNNIDGILLDPSEYTRGNYSQPIDILNRVKANIGSYGNGTSTFADAMAGVYAYPVQTLSGSIVRSAAIQDVYYAVKPLRLYSRLASVTDSTNANAKEVTVYVTDPALLTNADFNNNDTQAQSVLRTLANMAGGASAATWKNGRYDVDTSYWTEVFNYSNGQRVSDAHVTMLTDTLKVAARDTLAGSYPFFYTDTHGGAAVKPANELPELAAITYTVRDLAEAVKLTNSQLTGQYSILHIQEYYNAVSLLNGNVVTRIQVTKNKTTGAISYRIRGAGVNNDQDWDNQWDWNWNNNDLSIASNRSYYVVTNNVNPGETSDVVTVIEFVDFN